MHANTYTYTVYFVQKYIHTYLLTSLLAYRQTDRHTYIHTHTPRMLHKYNIYGEGVREGESFLKQPFIHCHEARFSSESQEQRRPYIEA